ncbi:MAG TPA: ATP-dependent DNA ligase [Burkholderiales bacterium]|nr:ATP-dependent DNA ligase [Burkholderiales bacterium]
MTGFIELVGVSERVAGTASRLAKVRELAEFLRKLAAEEIEIALPYLSGETRQGKLAVGGASLQSARTAPAAEPALTIAGVDATFQALKQVKGKGSAGKRSALLRELFAHAAAAEQDFLVRLIVGELRQGALEGIMVEAVAAGAALPPADVRRAVAFAGAVAPVASAALSGGAAALTKFSIQLMQPVLPMLAQPAVDIPGALQALGTALIEWKLDGARVQVHKSGSDVRVYTRNLNDVTSRVPEIVAAVRAASAGTLILDGEAIALRADSRPHPFPVTMSRFGSQQEDERRRAELPLSVFFFDCLYKDGASLVDHPTRERREALQRALPPNLVTPALVTADAGEAQRFYESALAAGHEGVMAKALDAPYEAGRRGAGWLKVKRAHTLDLVVLAAEWGHGRRKGWLSNLHLGARDPRTGGFVMLGKTFKGMTDALLKWQTEEFLKRETGRDEWTVRLRPELVVEIAFNDLQESSQYPGGLALRFARVKGYRPDKRPDEADTIDTVREIYRASLG